MRFYQCKQIVIIHFIRSIFPPVLCPSSSRIFVSIISGGRGSAHNLIFLEIKICERFAAAGKGYIAAECTIESVFFSRSHCVFSRQRPAIRGGISLLHCFESAADYCDHDFIADIADTVLLTISMMTALPARH